MCYRPANIKKIKRLVHPDKGKYKCNVCSKITRYKSGAHIVKNLLKARSLIDEFKAQGYDAQLDEREYCKYCKDKSDIKIPKPVFKIRFNENDPYHSVRTELHYFKYLQTFLQGGDHFINDNNDTVTSYEIIDIIYKITGLGEEIVNIWHSKIKKQQRPMYEQSKLNISNYINDLINNVNDDPDDYETTG